MASIADTADRFFVACESGKGWEACKAFCTPDASFAAQAEPLADVKSLQQYCDWMKRLLGFIPDGRYELGLSQQMSPAKVLSGNSIEPQVAFQRLRIRSHAL